MRNEPIDFIGVGFDIGCGNMAARLDTPFSQIESNVGTIIKDVHNVISFGVGRTNDERVEHELFDDADAWDVLDDIPNGSAAALLLIEHHWAVGLRDAVMRTGGYRVADNFISPLDLIGVGLVSAAEAAALHAVESASVPG